MTSLVQAVGKEAYAIVAGEIGGGNGLEALSVAADMGLPVVDGDFMGRAFPELQVTSNPTPYFFCTYPYFFYLSTLGRGLSRGGGGGRPATS